jgi:hypothetical protein
MNKTETKGINIKASYHQIRGHKDFVIEQNVLDQLIAISDTLLDSPQNLTLLESRALPIALSQALESLSDIADIDLSTFEHIVALNQVPRRASIKKSLAGNRAHCDAVLARWSRASRTGSLGH